MIKLSHLIAIVPIAVLLTMSFFVLFALRKVEEKALKAFGYLVVGFLWLSALVVFSAAVYRIAQGSVLTRGMMQQKMKMDCMAQMMRKDNPPMMTGMPGKGPMVNNDKRPGMAKCGGNKGIVFKAE